MLCVLSFVAFACDQDNEEEVQFDENAVLLVEYVYYMYSNYEDGETKEVTELSSKFEYDKQGRITKHIWYYDEEVQGTWEYTYDEAGEVKSETYHSTYNSMAPDNHTKNGNTITSDFGKTITLNDQGLPVFYQLRDEDHLVFTYTYTYDGEGNIRTETFSDNYDNYTITYDSYDDGKSPFYSCSSPKWLPIIMGYHTVNNPADASNVYNNAGYLKSDGHRKYTYIEKKK
jgi:hypothetical protein